MSAFGRLGAALRSRLGHDSQQIVLLLVALACIVLPHFPHLPTWAALGATATFSLKLAWVLQQRPPAHRWLLHAITFTAVAGTFAQYGTILGRDAGVTLLAILSCMKLLELRARRDIVVLMCLSYFLALCQFLYSQSIVTAIMVALGVSAMLTAQIAQHTEGDAVDDSPVPLSTVLRLSARIQLMALPVAFALFLLFPRLSGPLWGQPADNASSTGLSDSMSPGDISVLVESDELAFRATFPQGVPAPSARYFRAIVLAEFDGRTWRPLSRPPGVRMPIANVRTLSPPIAYELAIEPQGKTWLYALDMPVTPPRAVGDAGTPVIINDDASTFSARRPLRTRTVFAAQSALDYRLLTRETPASLQWWLALPETGNPRARAFAASIAEQTNSPQDRVRRLLAHFHNAPFRYTLSPPALGDDTVDAFLFETRAGFCEHYASTFVFMMRAMGIPARVVTGYQGGEVNGANGVLEVRQRDAHAWAEVWLGTESGWTRIDPTAAVAPERVERGFERGMGQFRLGGVIAVNADSPLASVWRSVRDRWSAIEHAWNQRVLQFNTQAQRSFLERLGFEQPDWRTLMLATSSVLALTSAAIALGLYLQRKRPDPWVDALMQFESRLARHGVRRVTGEPVGILRARIRAHFPPAQADIADRILSAYEAARYQPHAATAADLRQLRQWISRFRP